MHPFNFWYRPLKSSKPKDGWLVHLTLIVFLKTASVAFLGARRPDVELAPLDFLFVGAISYAWTRYINTLQLFFKIPHSKAMWCCDLSSQLYFARFVAMTILWRHINSALVARDTSTSPLCWRSLSLRWKTMGSEQWVTTITEQWW